MNIENVGALAQSLKESIHKRGKIKAIIINVFTLNLYLIKNNSDIISIKY